MLSERDEGPFNMQGAALKRGGRLNAATSRQMLLRFL
jgi:hypothetical protein